MDILCANAKFPQMHRVWSPRYRKVMREYRCGESRREIELSTAALQKYQISLVSVSECPTFHKRASTSYGHKTETETGGEEETRNDLLLYQTEKSFKRKGSCLT